MPQASSSLYPSLFKCSIILVLICASLWPTSGAFAQSEGGQNTPKVLMLITEHLVQGQESKKVSSWWVDLPKKSWTPTDQALLAELETRQVRLFTPPSSARISKVFLQPDLPLANASALAKLLGARYAFVGTVRYVKTPLKGLRAQSAWEGTASIQLVDTSTQKEVLSPLVVSRLVFGQGDQNALQQTRLKLSRALAGMIKSGLSQLSGPVGLQQNGEKFLVLRGSTAMGQVEVIKRRLEALKDVKQVQIRWVGQGQIALEINPGSRDAPTVIEQAKRTLVQAPFDGFALAASGQVESLYSVTLDLVPVGAGSTSSEATR